MTKTQLIKALADWEDFELRLAELNQDRDLGDMLIPAPVMLASLRTLAEAAQSYLAALVESE